MFSDAPGSLRYKRLTQMKRDLMTEKGEIDPAFCRPSFVTAQNVAVKIARRIQIQHIERKVKWGEGVSHGMKSLLQELCIGWLSKFELSCYTKLLSGVGVDSSYNDKMDVDH